MSRSWGRRWACIGLVAVGSLGAALMVNVLIKTGARPRLAEILGEQEPEITVYGERSCGCCLVWARHLRQAGFEVSAVEGDRSNPVRQTFAARPELLSCHTAIVGGYVIEGHVPVEVIVRLLRERPDLVGLAVSGMPAGSTGMGMVEKNADSYDIIALDRSGGVSVYARR